MCSAFHLKSRFLQNNFQALLQISPQIKLVLKTAKLYDIAINWGQLGLKLYKATFELTKNLVK